MTNTNTNTNTSMFLEWFEGSLYNLALNPHDPIVFMGSWHALEDLVTAMRSLNDLRDHNAHHGDLRIAEKDVQVIAQTCESEIEMTRAISQEACDVLKAMLARVRASMQPRYSLARTPVA